MKLAELDPHWIGGTPEEPSDAKQGLSFLCPHCQELRLAVFFDVPICGRSPVDLTEVHRQQVEGEHLADHHVGKVLWHREGTTFEDLSLTPSIDASHFGHWHGFIIGGQIS